MEGWGGRRPEENERAGMERKSEGKKRMEGSGAAGQSSHRAVVPIKEEEEKLTSLQTAANRWFIFSRLNIVRNES